MNTCKLYIVDVGRIIKTKGAKWSYGIICRKTIVYDNNYDYGCYYDLIAKKMLPVGLNYSCINNEYIKQDSFVSFNDYLHNKKENLSKRKIKKLYIEHENNVNNK